MITEGPSRGGGGSRGALLAAARELFTAHGFDRTTVRAIADRAGVNQALLFRHYGSKDALFAAALADEATRLAAAAAPEDLLATVLRRMFDGDDGVLYAALRSPGHATALAALRDELGAPFRRAFTGLVDADPDASGDAELRADLLMAWLFGIGFARAVLGVESLCAAGGEQVTAHVERAARALLLGGPDASV